MIGVSIIITSYNKADTVARAIKSVLAQKTTFKIQVVVVDDGSTDESKSEIRKATTFHGNKMAYVDILWQTHAGMMKTYINGFKECKGMYIAFCDCDDYWNDENKLQRQFDHMEANEDCIMCFTDIETNGKLGKFHEKTDYNQMLRGACVPSPSVMLRNVTQLNKPIISLFIKNSPYKDFVIWDYPIFLFFALNGRVDYLKGVTAFWTSNEESVTRTKSRGKRFRYIWGMFKIKMYFIRYSMCRLSTLMYILYRFGRDIVSIILRKW
jgi:glycosyltransferase involved in cell wall biosynthesis